MAWEHAAIVVKHHHDGPHFFLRKGSGLVEARIDFELSNGIPEEMREAVKEKFCIPKDRPKRYNGLLHYHGNVDGEIYQYFLSTRWHWTNPTDMGAFNEVLRNVVQDFSKEQTERSHGKEWRIRFVHLSTTMLSEDEGTLFESEDLIDLVDLAAQDGWEITGGLGLGDSPGETRWRMMRREIPDGL